MIQIEGCLVTAIDCRNLVFIVVVGEAFYTCVCQETTAAERPKVCRAEAVAIQVRVENRLLSGEQQTRVWGALPELCVHEGCVELASVKNV